jgi:hypothetical protein
MALASLPRCVSRDDVCEHVRLHLPDGDLRLDMVDGSLLDEMVSLQPLIDVDREIDEQLISVRRVAGYVRGSLKISHDQRLLRLVEALRVSDAVATGASLRDIGLGGFPGQDWPGDGEHLKSRVRRRIELARKMKRAGPRAILRHDF